MPCADTVPPPRQAELDTSPQEGNCLVQIRCHHPVKRSLTSPPQEGNCLVQIAGGIATTPSSGACHPSIGGRLPCADTGPPPRQAELDTPPQEGNCLVQIRGHHPVKRSLTPLHRRGIALCRYGATTPSSWPPGADPCTLP